MDSYVKVNGTFLASETIEKLQENVVTLDLRIKLLQENVVAGD